VRESIILGIDPGVSGAYAFYWPDRDMIAAEDAPVVDGGIDAANMAAAIDVIHPSVVIIERVGAMPKQASARRSNSASLTALCKALWRLTKYRHTSSRRRCGRSISTSHLTKNSHAHERFISGHSKPTCSNAKRITAEPRLRCWLAIMPRNSSAPSTYRA